MKYEHGDWDLEELENGRAYEVKKREKGPFLFPFLRERVDYKIFVQHGGFGAFC